MLGSNDNTYLDNMNIRLSVIQRVNDRGISSSNFSKIKRTLPCLETAFVEIRVEIALFKAGDEFGIVVILIVLSHQLSADVEDLSTRNH